MASTLTLVAPLDGWSAPLEETPDEVFAGRILGAGVAIDPTSGTLYAPCSGTITVVAAARHAVTLRAANGVEILLHIGIDTVHLRGEGFEVHVQQGQEVRCGEPLIEFDLDLLAQKAKSLLSPIIVTSAGTPAISRQVQARSVRAGDFLMEVAVPDGDPSVPEAGSGTQSDTPLATARERTAPPVPNTAVVRHQMTVPFQHGIHARPAALLSASVRGLRTDISLVVGERRANAKSPIALLSLGAREGEPLLIEASGPDAQLAIARLTAALHEAVEPIAGIEHSREPGVSGQTSSGPAVASSSPRTPAEIKGASTPWLTGVIASRGLAVGPAYRLERPRFRVPESGQGAEHEQSELARARALVREELRQSIQSTRGAAREVATAHLELIDDPELVASAERAVRSGQSAGYAWRQAIAPGIETLRSLDDPRLAARADDLLDLESRVLSQLGGQPLEAIRLPVDSIVIADELLPSQLVGLDAEKVAGICLAGGGPTSHVAIIAGSLGIPMVVALGPDVLRIAPATVLLLDADAGRVAMGAGEADLAHARVEVARRRRNRGGEQAAAQNEARTRDGTRVEVFANIGSIAEAHSAVRNGAEGCGLLRTEFLFLDRQTPPTESEQATEYVAIARALEGRLLTIRTLDVGGDKPIAYLPMPPEENPALGLRGVRASLSRPDLLRVQLAAVMQVASVGPCRILVPMITEVDELRAVRAVLDEVSASQRPTGVPPLGVMIETPASAAMADVIVREADFLSIGTNDLTQYTLAMDRGHPDLAARADGLHPAVLRLIARAVAAGRERGRPVAVCGGLASEALAVPVLVGLGVRELSMAVAVIPRLKSLIATLSVAACASLAREALEQENAAAVRALIRSQIQGAVP